MFHLCPHLPCLLPLYYFETGSRNSFCKYQYCTFKRYEFLNHHHSTIITPNRLCSFLISSNTHSSPPALGYFSQEATHNIYWPEPVTELQLNASILSLFSFLLFFSLWQSTYNIKLPIATTFTYTVVLRIFILLCSHHHHPLSRTLHCPRLKLCGNSILTRPPIFLPQALADMIEPSLSDFDYSRNVT